MTPPGGRDAIAPKRPLVEALRPWVVATTAPKRPMVEALPGWLAAWWTWSERGVAAWAIAVPTVAGWLLVGVALVVLAPVALVGWACRALVGGRGR